MKTVRKDVNISPKIGNPNETVIIDVCMENAAAQLDEVVVAAKSKVQTVRESAYNVVAIDAKRQAAGNGNRTEAAQSGKGERQQSQGFADITVSPQAKRYIHIASLLLIFGSYLYLRLRKAGLKKQEEQ